MLKDVEKYFTTNLVRIFTPGDSKTRYNSAMQNLLQDTRQWRLLLAALFVAGVAWIWLSRVPEATGQTQMPSPRAGFPAPEVRLAALTGEQVSLADWRGQVVILNVWASWCVPCRAEMPAFERVYAQHRAQGLTILAVNSTVQDVEANARAFAQEFGLTFPVLLDAEGVVTRRYLVRALPSTFFIDRQGVIRSVVIGGPLSEAALVAQVEELLGEEP